MDTTPTQEVVAKLIAWIEASADFAKEQWPDYAAQCMRSEIIKGWFNILFLFLLLAICFTVWFYCVLFTWKFEGKSYEIPIFVQGGTFFPFIGVIGSIFGLVAETHNLINIYVAPKVYMLKHLSGFIK